MTFSIEITGPGALFAIDGCNLQNNNGRNRKTNSTMLRIALYLSKYAFTGGNEMASFMSLLDNTKPSASKKRDRPFLSFVKIAPLR